MSATCESQAPPNLLEPTCLLRAGDPGLRRKSKEASAETRSGKPACGSRARGSEGSSAERLLAESLWAASLPLPCPCASKRSSDRPGSETRAAASPDLHSPSPWQAASDAPLRRSRCKGHTAC